MHLAQAMLLRFGIRNFRSIRDMQEVSLVASGLDDPAEGLIDCSPAGKQLLPAIVIYGANASGKSNLIKAPRWMRGAVLQSHTRRGASSGIPHEPFALDPATRRAPTTCDADFVINDVRYHYGFEATSEVFTREWLHSFPNNRRQLLFERESQQFEFGRGLRGRNRVIADLTRPNSLFVSAATQNDHEELSKISEFFRAIAADDQEFAFRRHELDPREVEFLGAIGTGVVGRRLKKLEINDKQRQLTRDLFSVLKKSFEDLPDVQFDDDFAPQLIELAHRDKDGTEIYFDLEAESDGTRRLISLLEAAFRTLDAASLMVVDELDDGLHTQACEALLALFVSPKTNRKGAQLVATTHDTNLLRCPLLRRDQVWFAEKDPKGATHLYPLTDFRTRKGDNLERGYLQGRYGAIPFSGSPADIMAPD
jgi:predicted ATPase